MANAAVPAMAGMNTRASSLLQDFDELVPPTPIKVRAAVDGETAAETAAAEAVVEQRVDPKTTLSVLTYLAKSFSGVKRALY